MGKEALRYMELNKKEGFGGLTKAQFLDRLTLYLCKGEKDE